jgi:hypothetical protein
MSRKDMILGQKDNWFDTLRHGNFRAT